MVDVAAGELSGGGEEGHGELHSGGGNGEGDGSELMHILGVRERERGCETVEARSSVSSAHGVRLGW